MNFKEIVLNVQNEAQDKVIDFSNSFESEADAVVFISEILESLGAKSKEEFVKMVENLINSDNDEDFEKFVDLVAAYIADEESDEIDQEDLEAAIFNIFALYNTLKEEDDDNEIIAKAAELLMEENNEVIEDNGDEDGREEEEEIIEDKEEVEEESPIEEVDNKESANMEGKIKIISPKEKISDKPWGQVDKTKLKNDIKTALEEGIPGAKEALYEIFALVQCEDKMGCWKYPHHEFDGEEVVLNTNGLTIATIFFAKPMSQKALTPEERKTIANHLIRHYEELGKDVPPSLKRIAENKESLVEFDVSIEDISELAQKLGVSIETLGSYLTVIEKLVAETVDEGFAEVEGEEKSGYTQILIKLTKEQLEQLVNLIDKFNINLFKVLNGEEVNLEDKDKDLSEIENLKAKLNEAVEAAIKYKEENEELKRALDQLKAKADKVDEYEREKRILENKIELLVSAFKKFDDFDENIVMMILDANDEKELTMLRKLSESAVNPKIKFNKITGDDVELLGEVNILKENKESGTFKQRKDIIADLL